MKTIALAGKKGAGRVVLVDDEDYALVAPHRWTLFEYPPRPGRGQVGPYAKAYIRRNGKPSTVLMHTFITGWPLTDHEDHNGLNNQRYNLRPATPAQNRHNSQAGAGHSSKYKGVSWARLNRKWRAVIGVDGRRRHIGLFATEEEAALAYNAAAVEAFGPYACLNEITLPVEETGTEDPQPQARAA